MSRSAPIVFAAVEGMTDEVVLRRLIDEIDASTGPVHVAGGKANLRRKVNGYNHAARHLPWVILVDLNHEADCAPALRADWLPSPNRLMLFRVAVRTVEAWLLADAEQIAQFLRVSVARVPRFPDSLIDPKRTLIDLARHSGSRAMREDMVPRPKTGRSEGPAYASRIMEFARGSWRPSIAQNHSDSLRRCREALRRLLFDYRARGSHT